MSMEACKLTSYQDREGGHNINVMLYLKQIISYLTPFYTLEI